MQSTEDRELYHLLMNFEYSKEPQQLLQRAHQFIEQKIKEIDPLVKHFPYSEKALDEFLNNKYQKVQGKYEKYLIDKDYPHKTREQMEMYCLQFSPAKLVDGVWLQSIAKAHNLRKEDNQFIEIINLLFAIYAEELGEATVKMNHAAIYKDLVNNLGVQLSEPASAEFAYDPRLWDSAYTVGTLQLCLGQFGVSYLPVLLGYTLAFEQLPWPLLKCVDEMKALGMDSYYFQLHVSIDNLASGHGFMAAKAVKMYMEYQRLHYGAESMESSWKRVLQGFNLYHVKPLSKDIKEYCATGNTPKPSPPPAYISSKQPSYLTSSVELGRLSLNSSSSNLDQQGNLRDSKEENTELAKSKELSSVNYKQLFHQLINTEIYPSAFTAARALVPKLFPAAHSANQSFTMNFKESKDDIFNGPSPVDSAATELEKIIKNAPNMQRVTLIAEQLSPLFFLEGICIQNVNIAGWHHTHMGAKLMEVYMPIWGYMKPLTAHYLVYDNLLKTLRVYLPEITNKTFLNKENKIPSSAVEFSVAQLAISNFPRDYYPEVFACLEHTLTTNFQILKALVQRLNELGVPNIYESAAAAQFSVYQKILSSSREAVSMYFNDMKCSGDPFGYQRQTDRYVEGRKTWNSFTAKIAAEITKH
eukprot:TRINITY_DN4580_c0_g1_i1.p1 TRINITY_DN4580_c0_g1~~TRINITY_DN4580_c0_g1_i1.p1  ORF type:complete len:661 (-),score=159.48 TRINITY_DN4580_c0_g1_i1:51-1976(-)